MGLEDEMKVKVSAHPSIPVHPPPTQPIFFSFGLSFIVRSTGVAFFWIEPLTFPPARAASQDEARGLSSLSTLRGGLVKLVVHHAQPKIEQLTLIARSGTVAFLAFIHLVYTLCAASAAACVCACCE